MSSDVRTSPTSPGSQLREPELTINEAELDTVGSEPRGL